MKTICRLPNFDTPNVSLYLFDDSVAVNIESDRTVVGPESNPYFVVLDCNTSNCILHEGVSDPGNWEGWKYFYTTQDGWELNPDWIPPAP